MVPGLFVGTALIAGAGFVLSVIDTHCHLDFDVFDAARGELLADCRRAGVNGWLIPGTTAARWPKLLRLAELERGILLAAGLHPYFTAAHQPNDLDALEKQLQSGAFCAVGEIGLDQWPEQAPIAQQQWWFRAQLQLAQAARLPLILHARKSEDLILKCIRETRFQYGGIVHAFAGSLQQGQRFLDFGFKLGFGAAATHPRAQRLRRTWQALPMDGFVLETDAPDMPPAFLAHGVPNSPRLLPLIAQVLAHLKDENLKTLCAASNANFHAVIAGNLSNVK